VPAATVIIGTVIAQLSNTVGPTREKIFKSVIFMPMAISFISASTIWKYLYWNANAGRPQIGLLTNLWQAAGGEPVEWLNTSDYRLNSFLLMIIIIWLQAGYAMVMISSAIKGVPEETLEAARIDGANARQIFFRVILPQIRGTVMSVFVTVLILVMKIFDIILGMTGGNHKTSVLGFLFYREFYEGHNIGPAAAVVTILTILILPIVWWQIRSYRQQEALR
jgi:alpha-glucoside transport system permease protein